MVLQTIHRIPDGGGGWLGRAGLATVFVSLQMQIGFINIIRLELGWLGWAGLGWAGWLGRLPLQIGMRSDKTVQLGRG